MLYDNPALPNPRVVEQISASPERLYLRMSSRVEDQSCWLRELKEKLLVFSASSLVAEVWEKEVTLPAHQVKETSNSGMHCDGGRYKYGHDYGNYVYSTIWNLVFCYARQQGHRRLVHIMEWHMQVKPSLMTTSRDTKASVVNKGDKIEVVWALARRPDIAEDWGVAFPMDQAHELYAVLHRICVLVTHLWAALQRPIPFRQLAHIASTDFSSYLFHAMRCSDASADLWRICLRLL